jgi:hypothetical protein
MSHRTPSPERQRQLSAAQRMSIFRQRQWEEPSAGADEYGATRGPPPDDASESADESSSEEEEEGGSVRDVSIADEQSSSRSSNSSTYDEDEEDAPEPAELTPRVSLFPHRPWGSPGKRDATEARLGTRPAHKTNPGLGRCVFVDSECTRCTGKASGLCCRRIEMNAVVRRLGGRIAVRRRWRALEPSRPG